MDSLVCVRTNNLTHTGTPLPEQLPTWGAGRVCVGATGVG
jgi:hypothetical protein